jgi:2-polyprenyl-3-methyl-5-hydroxy-6-metoxy-1,4-benzoquinol methylase
MLLPGPRPAVFRRSTPPGGGTLSETGELRRRAAGDERMDDPDADPAELARSLADLRAVNRWLGGTRVLLRHLGSLFDGRAAAPRRILDVATGSADIPLSIVRHARARDHAAEVVATDFHPATLALARAHTAHERAIRVEAADALHLPYADGSFDGSIICTALHHFDARGDVVRVLRELHRVSRLGIVVSDLRRSRAALVGARLLAATVWRTHPLTRHDGPLSVRRAFTPAELMDYARAADLPNPSVHAHPIFRVVLVSRRTPPGGS